MVEVPAQAVLALLTALLAGDSQAPALRERGGLEAHPETAEVPERAGPTRVDLAQSHRPFEFGVGHAHAVVDDGDAAPLAVPRERNIDPRCLGSDAVVDDVGQGGRSRVAEAAESFHEHRRPGWR